MFLIFLYGIILKLLVIFGGNLWIT
jgi:hypothetical protein